VIFGDKLFGGAGISLLADIKPIQLYDHWYELCRPSVPWKEQIDPASVFDTIQDAATKWHPNEDDAEIIVRCPNER
jgi:hypothetical protein